MRRSLLVAAVLLGAVALVSADDTKSSFPKHGTGAISCVTPIDRVKCTRDIRSGFVAGIQYSNEGVEGFAQVCSSPSIPVSNPAGGVGGGPLGQITYDLSVVTDAGTRGSIAYANDRAGPPNNLWYRLPGPEGVADEADLAPYTYPAGAPITQVIVLEAKNPFGEGFGKIPAIIFVYINDEGTASTAVCGNPIYANFYLDPENAPAPPTAVKLLESYSSPLVQPKFEDEIDGEKVFLGALGGFQAKCSPRGTGYLGGDPNKVSRFAIEDLKKVCFLPANLENNPFNCGGEGCKPGGLPDPTNSTNFACDNDDETEAFCTTPCAYNKKTAKNGVSASCEFNGFGFVTGKFGLIEVDSEGTPYEWTYGSKGDGKSYGEKEGYQGGSKEGKDGVMQRVKFEGSIAEKLAEQVKAVEASAEETEP